MTAKTAPIAKGQVPLFDDDDIDAPTIDKIGIEHPTPSLQAEAETVLAEYREAPALAPMVVYEEPATHHLVVGMGTLAAMSEEDFDAKLAVMQKGQDRIRIIQDKLLVLGEDYGKVKGIDKPFLHQPGAEKMSNFYGFAVEQIAERLAGDGITSPPLAYHVKSLVHLGDFDGPVIAMGYGESSSWEEKYRYRWAKATCPKCGREGLIKGKADGKLKGKWWCPQREGGCNSTFEAADPQVAPPAKVENPDPWSMAETLIQMAGKRSFVASIRRATGTSGLFTQDEDSPSVRQQVGDEPPEREPVLTAGPEVEVGVGAKTSAPSMEQLQRLVALSKEKDIDKAGMAALFKRLFGLTVAETSPAITAAARSLTADELGRMLWTMETGELTEEATPGFPPQSSDEM
jgi:hypothetical protein